MYFMLKYTNIGPSIVVATTTIIMLCILQYKKWVKSKSLTWSSVVLAFENSKGISEEVKKPKALGDIRGVSYIYPILWRFGLIRVPEAIEKKMGKQR